MKILLALDGSPYSNAAIESVAKRSYQANAEVRIISVYPTSSGLFEMNQDAVLRKYYAEIDQSSLESAKEITKEAARTLQEKNPKLLISTVEVGGSAKRMILEEAKSFGADLIILGAHGYGRVEGFLLGSVSQSIMLHAKCSVEVVRKP